MDRAEHSKRQDWSLEAAYDIFPLLDPLLSYTVATLLDKSNVLRDSVLMQAECLHFEAYVHVCTIMWRVVFKELRGLTNSKVGTSLYALYVVWALEYVLTFWYPMFVVFSRVNTLFKTPLITTFTRGVVIRSDSNNGLTRKHTTYIRVARFKFVHSFYK